METQPEQAKLQVNKQLERVNKMIYKLIIAYLQI